MASHHVHSIFKGYLHDGKVAVIDIGSNSIRLVVYDGVKRVPLPIYNEKAFCSLGKGLSRTNRLHPEGMRMARRVIARLLAIVRMMEITELHIIATAAIRDADDGKAFVKEIERVHKVKIKVISGKKEAQYAAFGVLSGHYKPHGLVGDLGGGSLELTSLNEPELKLHDTMQLGALRLTDRAGDDRNLMRELVQKQLKEIDWLRAQPFDQFYAIGGSFRALAKMHMKENDYPLDLMHHYTLNVRDAQLLLQRLAEWPEAEMDSMPISAKRRIQMPAAAIVMQEILKFSRAKQVIFSTSGIREGLLYSLLSPYVQQEDPLIASCVELAEQNGRHMGYHSDVFEWMNLAFKHETEEERRLRAAACTLSELAWRIHRPSRGEWVYHRIIHSSLVGISHQERVALAAALYHRYEPVWKGKWGCYQLLDERMQGWVRAVGAGMGLAYYLSGGLPGNLQYAVLKPESGKPRLRMSAESKMLQGEKLDQRLETFSTALAAFNRLAQ